MSTPRILLVDDEPAILFTLEEALTARGNEVVACGSVEHALARLDGVDTIVTDLVMPGAGGLDLLAAVRERDPGLPVILLTARGSEKAAVSAMKAGAHDYLQKPFSVEEVALVVARAVETRRLRQTAHRLTVERAIGRPLVGDSAVFRALVRDASLLADRDIPVLVRGETGTGKELVASLLHASSRRAARPLVRFSCAAIPEALADAELFGHARGAFTGAQGARRGFFAQADGGTLVLDEVGELPMGLQPKLLRALQEGEIQPVGASRVERVDVRVVACTHRDLAAEVAAGRFRQDLYYRLAVVELVVPPLRARRTDIPALVDAFVRRYAQRFGLDDASLSTAVVRDLAARDWPGNVRELENVVARLLALSTGGEIDVDALARVVGGGEPALSPTAPTGEAPSFREQVAAFERTLLAGALRETRGNQSEAARRLGLTRVTLLDKLKRHGLRS